jgi:hypothetical protein
MNKISDFSISTEELWHKIGDTIAPKNIWGKSLPERVGLLSIRVKSPRRDSLPGHISVGLEPSKTTKHGITMNINSHVDLQKEECPRLDEILLESWEKSLDIADTICNETISGAIHHE